MSNILNKTKRMCREHDIKPVRHRGQSFLVRESVYDDIISASELKKNDKILEVGPGLGFLTEKLAQKSEKVISVELDKKLYDLLRERLSGLDNLLLFNNDILNIDPAEVLSGSKNNKEVDYKIVANIPYNITSVFLRKFLSQVDSPSLMVLMMQKEVTERILSSPPSGILSVMVQFYADIQKVEEVSRNDFWPSPKVDSAIIKLRVKKGVPPVDQNLFFDMVKKGFSSRRKMIKNNLSSGYKLSPDKIRIILKKANIDVYARAQDLYLEDWINLFGCIEKNVI
jgi:16S rRNA (adenine1518-N6/adenine1519-N6)-dimethyltransferase